MKLTKPVRAAAALVAVVAFVAAGCGDDDDDASDASASASDAGETDGLETEGASDASAFCDAAAEVDTVSLGLESGEASPEALQQAMQAAADAAPDEIAEAVGTMVTETQALMAEQAAAPEQEGGPPPIPTEAFFTASSEVGGYLSDNCHFETLDITATNYEFDGIPETVPAGTTVLNFTNEGTEFHEIALAQLPEGEERPLEELLALPEEPPLTDKAFVLAPPGVDTYVTADLEPGRYVGICFVPVGATPEALQSGAPLNEEDGHFMHGMVAEFTVS
jgi:hypothetical protein